MVSFRMRYLLMLGFAAAAIGPIIFLHGHNAKVANTLDDCDRGEQCRGLTSHADAEPPTFSRHDMVINYETTLQSESSQLNRPPWNSSTEGSNTTNAAESAGTPASTNASYSLSRSADSQQGGFAKPVTGNGKSHIDISGSKILDYGLKPKQERVLTVGYADKGGSNKSRVVVSGMKMLDGPPEAKSERVLAVGKAGYGGASVAIMQQGKGSLGNSEEDGGGQGSSDDLKILHGSGSPKSVASGNAGPRELEPAEASALLNVTLEQSVDKSGGEAGEAIEIAVESLGRLTEEAAASQSDQVPLLTFYLHGELDMRLASFAIGTAYAKLHKYEFRAFWEADEDFALPLESVFQVGDGQPIQRPPSGGMPPNLVECTGDITNSLQAKQSATFRASFRQSPLQNSSFRAESRDALRTISVSPEWAKNYLPARSSPSALEIVLFTSPQDTPGLESMGQVAQFVAPLMDRMTSSLLQPDNQPTFYIFSSHRSVFDVFRAFYRREVTGYLYLNGQKSSLSWLAFLWMILGLAPNCHVARVLSSSQGIVVPSLLDLLPPSAKYEEAPCPSPRPVIPRIETNASGALFIVNSSNKTFTLHQDPTAAVMTRSRDFHKHELDRSVTSLNRTQAKDSLPVAIFTDAALLPSTEAQVTILLPINVTRSLGNYDVAAAVEAKKGKLLPKRLAKIKHMAQSPFRLTFYLDTDTVVCGSLEPCFSMLGDDDFDVLFGKESESPSSLNSGVVVYRRSLATDLFFRLWEHLYMFDCVLPGVLAQDQCALSTVLQLLPELRVGFLPSVCHLLVFNEDWTARERWSALHTQYIPRGKSVRLFHNRHFNESYYQSPELCDYLNKDVGRGRVLSFDKYGAPLMYFGGKACQEGTQQGCSTVTFEQ